MRKGLARGSACSPDAKADCNSYGVYFDKAYHLRKNAGEYFVPIAGFLVCATLASVIFLPEGQASGMAVGFLACLSLLAAGWSAYCIVGAARAEAEYERRITHVEEEHQ